MDAFGSLELAWCQGYNGCAASYITRSVICFKCGNNVRFLGEDGHESVFPAPSEGLGPVAVHGINKLFALATVGLDPSIYIYQYPSFREVAVLKGGAKLEYVDIVFSASDYIASISGVPEYQLTIWQYTTGTKLCTHDLSHQVPMTLSFNPADWRQLCLNSETEFSIWSIEQSHQTFMIKKDKVKLPSVSLQPGGDEAEPRDIPTRASTRMSRATVDLPRSSVAGVKGQEAERFEEYEDYVIRTAPVSHCWTNSGDILVGCAGGQLFKVDGVSHRVVMLLNPNLQLVQSMTRIDSAISEHSLYEGQSNASLTQHHTTEGSMKCITLHKSGIYAGGDDGILRRLEISQGHVKVVETQNLGLPITSLAFNQSYSHLAIGSSRGCIQVYDPADPANVQQLLDIHHGNFVAVDTLIPGNEHIVTLREDGELQVWKVDSAKLVSSLPIGFQTFSMAACPLSHTVAVGSASGYLFIIDLNKLASPRIVHRVHLHQGPIKHIVYSDNGKLLLTGSDDGHIFVLDGRSTQNFKPLGYVDMAGDIQSIAVHYETEGFTKVLVTSNASGKKELAATKLIHFCLPDDIGQDVTSKHASLKCDFRPDVIKKLAFNFAAPSFGAAVSDENVAFVLAQNSKRLHKITLPDQPPKKEASKDSYLHPMEEFPGHELAGGRLLMSPHGRWLASIGRDGILTIRAVGTLDRAVQVNAHDFHTGGVQDMAFSNDAHQMFTAGLDGTLTCYRWNFTTSGQSKAKSALESARARQMALKKEQQDEDAVIQAMEEWTMSGDIQSRPASATEKADKELSEKEHEIEKAIASDNIYTTPTPTPGSGATWLEGKELEALKDEDKQYSEVKMSLRSEIREMRRQLQAMMSQNETYPDIERLEHYEFDLDMEEQTRLQAEGDMDVQRIREEKEFENLAKMYLAELIKKECWDDMEIKGRGILSFGSSLEVANYPMRARSREELDQLERVKVLRQIELADLAARREFAEIHSKSGPADEEFNETDDVEGEGKEKPSTTGSLGSQYGGDSELFYSQFELHSREQKIMQVTLLEDAISRIKQTFNKEFDDVYKKKEQEIAVIAEKNKRIRKILDDLGLPVEVYEPVMGITEKPEMLLVVRDEEVKVEKYLTPEQRKREEEEKKEEEERRLKEKGDNWRDRGLDKMMGGVLEIKKEDELKKDIPVPAFMTGKSETEWSEDEKKAAAEYERKVKELYEEREKYHKQLEMELKKLQGQIQDSTQFFDELLQQLFLRKVKTEMVIYQEELKILRIRHSLLLEEELNNREEELNDLLEFKKEMKSLAGEALAEARKNVDAFRNDYDILLAEDKVMDKAFRREFTDVPAVYVEQLYKLFRRRPRGQKARVADTPTFDPNSGNPFAERPSTARKNQVAMTALEHAMVELDSESNKPEGLEPSVWDHLCQYRRQKVESENLVKQKALVLADMQDFLQKRNEEDEQLKDGIEDIGHSIAKLKEDRLRFTCNLEIQLLLKQGQVEVDPGPFIPDYTHSILTHRSVVEDLNSKIRQLGESKIASMVESKDFRKGIIQLEWEHKRMTMEMEDLHNKMRDIQNLKVSREIQAFLNENDYDSKKAQEIQTLEQTIQLQKEHHEKSVHEKKRLLKELKNTVKDKEQENKALSQELEELNVSVNERRQIHEVNADKRSDAGREERYHEIVQRRKLVDLAKAQAQEVAILRAEVERLRMRTFPALVQVEH